MSLGLIVLLTLTPTQQPIPQILNATAGEYSLEFYEGSKAAV